MVINSLVATLFSEMVIELTIFFIRYGRVSLNKGNAKPRKRCGPKANRKLISLLGTFLSTLSKCSLNVHWLWPCITFWASRTTPRDFGPCYALFNNAQYFGKLDRGVQDHYACSPFVLERTAWAKFDSARQCSFRKVLINAKCHRSLKAPPAGTHAVPYICKCPARKSNLYKKDASETLVRFFSAAKLSRRP